MHCIVCNAEPICCRKTNDAPRQWRGNRRSGGQITAITWGVKHGILTHIFWKIIKTVTTSCEILRMKCTKLLGLRPCRPRAGELTALLQTPYSWI